MRNILILVFIVLVMTGCMRRSSVENIELQPNTKITTPYISILSPSSYPKTPFETYSKYNSSTEIYIYRTIPNMMKEDIRIFIGEYQKDQNLYLLQKDKNKTFEEYLSKQYLSDWEMSNYLERGVNYSKQYVNFTSQLKCIESVESSNIANGVGSKKYSLNCPYYDNNGNKKHLSVMAFFSYTFNNTKFEGADNSSLTKYKFLDIKQQFKRDMKEIFDSLVINNIDREKMQKEELLYDKKYDVAAESKAKDLSLDCNMIKHADYTQDYWECVGKEINRKCTRRRKGINWECIEEK